MNATSLRDLLQQAVDRRNAEKRDASFRALQEAVEAEESVRPRGLSLNRTTASQILRGTYKGEASDGTIRAIGWLAGVNDEDAFAAAGRRSPGLPFAEELPPGVDDLSPKERRAAIEMLRTLVAQRREINRYVDSSTDTQEPRAPRKARKDKKTDREAGNADDYDLVGRDVGGPSEGELVRRQMDEDAERGDV
ncbi:immunity repressor [Gordonia phage Suerte]|uniref:Immunity repressor n=1 Tax=Gordonia phage Suerte TaxID=2652883 RepID=A0A5P8DE29_9CAUD|nr:transcriptional repressor [Gordonia phage Suerte]QFP97011.1 immunity repressor [Gordonia phage Suerte]